MTPYSFRTCLQSIGWSDRSLAEKLGIHANRVRRWSNGKYEVPPPIAVWVEKLAAVHDRHPRPDGWSESAAEVMRS